MGDETEVVERDDGLQYDIKPSGFTGIDEDTVTLLEDMRMQSNAILQLQLDQQISIQAAAMAAQTSRYAPVASTDLVIASSMAGVAYDDPMFAEILAFEQKKMEEGRSISDLSRSAGLSASKVGFLAMQTFWDEGLLSRGFRTGVQMAQGENPVDAYRRAGTSAGVEALASAIEGKPVDIGQGVMPGFTKPTESPAFAQSMVDLQDSDMPDEQKLATSLDTHFGEVGAPIVPFAQQTAESTLIHKTQDDGSQWVSPVSPGRAIGIQVFEPGTTPFNTLSGAVDFTANVVLDPADRALAAWGLYRHARNRFVPNVAQNLDAAQVALRVEQAEQTRRAGGVFGNTRFTVTGQKATDWAVTTGRGMREFLVKNKSMRAIKVMFPDISVKDARKLIDADTIEDVDVVLLPLLGTTIERIPGGRPLLVARENKTLSQTLGGMGARGGSRAMGREVGSLAGLGPRVAFNAYTNPTTRLFSELHKGRFLASDPDSTYRTADDFMRNAGFDPETADGFLYRLAEVPEGDIRHLQGTTKDILEEYKQVLMRQGWHEDVAEAQAKYTLNANRIGIYNQDDVGNPLLLSTTFDFDTIDDIDGADFNIHLPEASLLDEYVSWGISIPNSRSVRIGRSRMRRYRRNIRYNWNERLRQVDVLFNGRLEPDQLFERSAGRGIQGVGRESFEETGEMLHYGQVDHHEVIPEGGRATMDVDPSDASTKAGDNTLVERYEYDDFVEQARMAGEDPMVVRPQDMTAESLIERFPDELAPTPAAAEVVSDVPVERVPYEPEEFVPSKERATGQKYDDLKHDVDSAKGNVASYEDDLKNISDYEGSSGVGRHKLEKRHKNEFGGYDIDTPLGKVTITEYDKGEWIIETANETMDDIIHYGGARKHEPHDGTFPTLKEAEAHVREQYGKRSRYLDERLTDQQARLSKAEDTLKAEDEALAAERSTFDEAEAARKAEDDQVQELHTGEAGAAEGSGAAQADAQGSDAFSGNRIDPTTDGERFLEGVQRTYDDHELGRAVEVKDPEFYIDPASELHLSEDGLTGAAVTPEGDLVSVFRHPDGTVSGTVILDDAATNAVTLDAFNINGFLPDYYARYGFKPVARVKFDINEAPPGWDVNKLGEPDVVFMVRDPDGVTNLPSGKYSDIEGDVPLLEYGDAWDLKMKYRSEVVNAKDVKKAAFSTWFNEQRKAGGTFHVTRNGRRVEVKTAKKMKEHVANGLKMEYTPKVRRKTVASMRKWYQEQVGGGFGVQVRTPARKGDVAGPWQSVESEDAFIGAMGGKSDVRVLPDNATPPVTSAPVYGKSLNLETLNLEAADPDLIKALIADGLVSRVDGTLTRVEGAEPEKIFDWMDDNGYGKYVNEDGTVEGLERYMGYNTESVYDDLTQADEFATFAYKSDRLSRVLNQLKLSDVGFDATVVSRILDTWQSKIFKPIVLLRAAWFARVTLEENIRSWMEGFDSFVSSPFRAMQWSMNHRLGGLNKKGRFDIGSVIDDVDDMGIPVVTKEYDELIDSRGNHDALASVVEQMRMGPNGTMTDIQYIPIKRGDPGYLKGWSRDIQQLMRSPEMGRLLDGGAEDMVQWMLNTRQGREMRRRIALDSSAKSPKRIILEDDEALLHHLQSLEARAHRIAGGEYHVQLADGTWASSKNINAPLNPQPQHTGGPYVIVQQGNDEILEWMRTGKQGTSDYLNKAPGKARQARMRKELERIHGDSPDAGPALVKGTGADMPRGAGTGFESVWDEMIRVGFNFLGSKPTNYLSRSPFFRQAYWDSTGRLYRYADDELRAYIEAGARNSNLSATDWARIQKRHGRVSDVDADTRVLTMDDRGLVDDLSKAKALDRTQNTLYDLSKRKNISQMTRFMFPFGEAFLELLQVWSKLIVKNPRVIRRGQQLLQGGRSSGFFHENDFGDEVFTVPGSSMLSQAVGLAPEGAGVGVDISLQSMNMVTSSPLPGFGTAAQLAGSLVLPETGALSDIANEVLFGGYARPKLENPLDVLASQLTPPWLRSMWTGIAGESSEWSNTYAGAVNETAEVLMMMNPEKYGLSPQQNPDGTYAFPGMTNEQIEAVYRDAKQKTSFLFIVRGILSFGSPGAPQLRWEVETNDGSAMTLRAAKQVWSDSLRANDYDSLAATKQFFERVGFDPTYMLSAKTQEGWVRANSVEGYALEQENTEQFDKYPATAGLAFQDPEWAEWSYNVFLKRIEEGSRNLIDADLHRLLVNARGGDIEYQAQLLLIDGKYAEYQAQGVPQAELDRWRESNVKSTKDWLKVRWVGWGTDQDLNTRTTADDMWREMTTTDGGWKGEILETDAGKAMLLFVPLYKAAQEASLAGGLSADGWLTSERGIATQMDLRYRIEDIIDQYPDFAFVAQKAILPQFRVSRDQWEQENPNSGLIFDPLRPPDPTQFQLPTMQVHDETPFDKSERVTERELVSP